MPLSSPLRFGLPQDDQYAAVLDQGVTDAALSFLVHLLHGSYAFSAFGEPTPSHRRGGERVPGYVAPSADCGEPRTSSSRKRADAAEERREHLEHVSRRRASDSGSEVV